ncbi:MAG: PEP-CTERM sorting domain-containing protein [Terriglobales bacterium]
MRKTALVALLVAAVPFLLVGPSFAGTIQGNTSFTVNGTVAAGSPYGLSGDAFAINFAEPSGATAAVIGDQVETDNVPVTYSVGSVSLGTVDTDVIFYDNADSGLFDLDIGNLDLSLFGPQIYTTDISGDVSFTPGVFSYGDSSGDLPSGLTYGDFNLNFAPGTVTVSTPEPGTMSLLALGLLALFGMAAWRRRSPVPQQAQ